MDKHVNRRHKQALCMASVRLTGIKTKFHVFLQNSSSKFSCDKLL